jgi:hypothetical protein
MTSTGIAEPPDTQSRSELVSYWSRSGWLSMAWYIVGTPWNTVTLSRWMISSALAGSKRGTIDSSPPTAIVAFRPQVWPKEWNSGSAPRTTSSAVVWARSIMPWALARRFAWVSSAPLGLPVVPDV